MFTQHMIHWAEHVAWFERMESIEGRHALVLEVSAQPRGVVTFNVDSSSMTGEWGFYKAPSAQTGTGMLLGKYGLTYAFGELALRKVYGEALSTNVPSRRLHAALGFTQEAYLREHYFNGVEVCDVVGFGILSSEWASRGV